MTIDVWAWGNLIGGLVVLSFAADWLVDGAAELSKSSNFSLCCWRHCRCIHGTSFPELVVSLLAARDGVVDLLLATSLAAIWSTSESHVRHIFVAKVMVTERNVSP